MSHWCAIPTRCGLCVFVIFGSINIVTFTTDSYSYTFPLISSLCNCAIWDIVHWNQFSILDFGWEAIEVTYARASMTDIRIIHYKFIILIYLYTGDGFWWKASVNWVWSLVSAPIVFGIVYWFRHSLLKFWGQATTAVYTWWASSTLYAHKLWPYPRKFWLTDGWWVHMNSCYSLVRPTQQSVQSFENSLCLWAWPFLHPSFCCTVTSTSVAMSRATGKY